MKNTLAICLLLAALGAGAAEQRFTYVDLVKRVTDLEQLALLPSPGEQCAQCSSYDRKSRYDEASGNYINWDANGDGDGVIRQEGDKVGDKVVMAEMEGPGCIWRIWSAEPKNGHVRIYLDGATKPTVDLPFAGYFDRKNAPFTRGALVHTVARGWNNYTPIPFSKSCKVVADRGWGAYYHFTYSTFSKGTVVPTFKRELTPEEDAALDEANRRLSACGPREDKAAASKISATFSPPEKTCNGNFAGPAALTSLRVKVRVPEGASEIDALRAISVQIRWDGEAEPSVWAPLGDFFGTAAGANQYRSFPMGLSDDGWWYCNWFMPFAKSAEIKFQNEGPLPIRLEFQAAARTLTGDVSRYGRFHAKWHRDALLPTEPERKIDWPMLKTEGAGRFVGVMLHIWNPRGGWWGEGDEKFFVDGEKFPSTFGTGSEDYFGYAWCNPSLFQNAFHNQTHNDGNNKGHVSVNRWHIPDAVPFQKSFEGDIEKYYSNERPTLYATMAYWYLAPGGRDPYSARPLSERIGYWTPLQTYKVKGALEGERLTVLEKTGGNVEEQDMTSFAGQWSNDAHLWWTRARPGDKLDLALPISKAANYRLTFQFTKAPDYGIAQLYLDGQKLGEPIDLYNRAVVAAAPLQLGPQELSAGQHKLTIEMCGANPKAIKNYMVGLDYIKLEAVP